MRGKRFLKMKVRVNRISGVFWLLFLTCLSSHAEEIRYPVPCYEGEELEKVRQWEKTWVGKRMDSTNIDKLKAFIPESLYQMIKEPETWGENWFEIAPYREIKPTKGELFFTKKYAGTCSIGADEEIHHYICGIPFPNPKTGLEIAYNFDNLNRGDNTHVLQEIVIIDGKSRYDRKMVMDIYLLYLLARREVPPVPAILPNDRGIYRVVHSSYNEPASMRGTRGLSIKFIDRSKPYESWSFSSTTRKLVRASTAQRQNTQGGGDSSVDDNMIYDNAISNMNYNYLGKKEMLFARHQDANQFKKGHREGYCLVNGFQRERIKTHVLECTHKNPRYLYSKQVWYIDPETWHILYADKYDRRGKLWRVFDEGVDMLKSVYNDSLLSSTSLASIIDVKRLHSTGSVFNTTIGETGEFYQLEYYTPKALQKYGY